jgi:glycosyltransferase involved in cell wall biosynthesis
MCLFTIVYVITRSDVIGGASSHLLDLAGGVQAKGHNVTIIVGGSGLVADVARSRGLDCICLPSLVREISLLKDIKCIFDLKSIFKALKPDLVHLHSAKAGMVGRLSAMLLGIPVVYTVHGWPFTEGVSSKKQIFYRIIEKVMARITSQIITVSEFDKEIAIRARVAKSEKMKVVHNGVSELLTVDVEPEKNRDPKLIMVARFEDPKDHQLVIRELNNIRDRKWIMEFIGDGPNLERAKETVSALGLDSRIIFCGACNDVPQRLSRADIFVLASRWEGFPLVILEAMRARLPVIASDVGGVKESVDHGVTGILVPRSSETGMAVALESLIGSPDLRNSMGLNGRASFEANFTLETMLNKTLKVYEHALK